MIRKSKDRDDLSSKLNSILPLVHEANLSAQELGRKIHFKTELVSETEDKPGDTPLEELRNSRVNAKVKVVNHEEGYSYNWDLDQFDERLFLIRDLVNQYFEEGKIPQVSQDEDPFWDPPTPELIGKGYLYLKSLSYMLDNPTKVNIISPFNSKFS